MEIIKSNIEEMMKEMNYVYEEEYSDNWLNNIYNYCQFMDKYENKIIVEEKASLEIILYSKYYWFSRFVDRYREIYGVNGGIEQEQFKIVEEIDHRVEDVDWEFVEKLDNGKV